jgi:hypothetical protein
VFVSESELNELVLSLKEEGYERSLEAVRKRVYDYQWLLTGQDSKYANEQERRIAELFVQGTPMAQAQRWINGYVNEVYIDEGFCDESDIIDGATTSLNNAPNQTPQYLTIEPPVTKSIFCVVLDELLEKYYDKHKNEKKTIGAVKKEFKDALVKDYAVPINTFNAIRREKYETISRKVLFRLCFALELDYEDAKRLLESVGYDFRRNVKFEVVIESILKCDSPRRFIIGEIDATLERYGCSRLFV